MKYQLFSVPAVVHETSAEQPTDSFVARAREKRLRSEPVHQAGRPLQPGAAAEVAAERARPLCQAPVSRSDSGGSTFGVNFRTGFGNTAKMSEH